MSRPPPAPANPDDAWQAARLARRRKADRVFFAILALGVALILAIFVARLGQPRRELEFVADTPEGCRVYVLTRDGHEIVICPVGWSFAPHG